MQPGFRLRLTGALAVAAAAAGGLVLLLLMAMALWGTRKAHPVLAETVALLLRPISAASVAQQVMTGQVGALTVLNISLFAVSFDVGATEGAPAT